MNQLKEKDIYKINYKGIKFKEKGKLSCDIIIRAPGQVDNKGKSRYNYDLEKEDPNARIHDDILRAFLKFTGGSYSNLVDMAINKKEVSKLILKSKDNKKPTMSVRRPAPKKDKNLDLGFN